MKKYALYLPQYHEIPENNEWWGQGFTEWTNVKKAKPLYRDHMQPKIPLHSNYYCLDDANTLSWQANLAKEYGIDGMVFYHYYFQGKLLLNKPIELLLENPDIDMNYFFCWANHSWYRSWSGSKELLIEQTYGSKDDWVKHFNYLLQFFKDRRYIKIDNKPVFMVFKSDFLEKKLMFDLFNELAVKNGYDGISIIETLSNYPKERNTNEKEYIHKDFIREPSSSLVELKKTLRFITFRLKEKAKRLLNVFDSKPVQVIPGDWLYNIMIKKYSYDTDIIRGIFFEWDNTPRHSNRGYIITPVTKKKFFEYMDLIKDEPFIIINAWNEWCEGMMLEPTEENGFMYLDWIKEWSNKE